MAGVSIRVELQNSESLEQIKERSQDMSTVFGDIGEYLRLSHQDRWQAQIASDHRPWLPLSPKYAASEAKLKSKGPDKILTFSGHLKDLHYQTSKQQLRLGTNKDYGAAHQFGSSTKGIPARPFLGISTEDRTEIMRLLRVFIAEGD